MVSEQLHRWKDTPLADANPQAEILLRRNRELGILNQIAQALNREVDLDQALDAVLAQVADLLHLRTGWIWLLRAGTDETYLAAAQNLPPGLADQPYRMEGTCYCLDTYRAGDLDGYNFMPYMTGETDEWPRKEFFYFTDDGDLAALRWNNWKVLFLEQRAHGWEVWANPFVPLRAPRLFNLRTDPLERAQEEAIGYPEWLFNRLFAYMPAQAVVKDFMMTFMEFPPRQKAASFSIDQAMAKMTEAITSNR